MREHIYYVYIATNKTHKVLYTGVSSELLNRDFQHKHKAFINGFTAKYNINKIVYFETYGYIGEAIVREKQIKAGSRQKKINLINSINPKWKDLIAEIKKDNDVEDGNKNVE